MFGSNFELRMDILGNADVGQVAILASGSWSAYTPLLSTLYRQCTTKRDKTIVALR
jgi:hypothetical protein